MYDTVIGISGDTLKSSLAQAFGMFFVIMIGSFLIGSLLAILLAFLMKREYKLFTDNEIVVVSMCPWVAYLIAESIDLSGIVSVLFNGIFLSQYCMPNVESVHKHLLGHVYHAIAYSFETLVFVFLGMGLFAFKHPFSIIGWTGIIFPIILFNVARFLNVVIVSCLINCYKKRQGEKLINIKM